MRNILLLLIFFGYSLTGLSQVSYTSLPFTYDFKEDSLPGWLTNPQNLDFRRESKYINYRVTYEKPDSSFNNFMGYVFEFSFLDVKKYLNE